MPFNAMQSRPPAPPSDLGRLRILSPHAAIRMSPIQFGGISVGTAWHEYTPPSDKDESFALLDSYVAAGGVSIDTANGYSDEQSETWIGEWMKARGNRDRLVIATKYTSDIGKNEATNLVGNSRKSMHVSLHASLAKLQTTYIDILYVHWWDWTTSISEMMDGLDAYVKQGKVLYLGASNMPAWAVSACNEYARARGQAAFVVYQGRYNIMERDMEQDVLPMCRHYGMAFVPWSALGSGRLKSQDQLDKLLASGELQEDSLVVKASRTLLDIAKKHGLDSWAPIALAWLYAMYPLMFPIVGMKSDEQLQQNIRSLSIQLDDDDMQILDSLSPSPVRMPYDMCGTDPSVAGETLANNALQLGTIDVLADRRVYGSRLHRK